MALKQFKSITPGQRGLVLVDRSELWKGGPEKSLTEGLSKKGGRNNTGRITARRRGGGYGERQEEGVRSQQEARDVIVHRGSAHERRALGGIEDERLSEDAIQPGERVLLVDDLIATGGTAEAAIKLLRRAGAEIVAAAFVIDLPELGGADRIRAMNCEVQALMAFEGH